MKVLPMADKRPRPGYSAQDLSRTIEDVAAEVQSASIEWPPFTTLHEAWAIVLEEVGELWDEVQRCQKDRDRLPYVRKEAVQVAAMAIRLIHDLC